MSNTALLTTQQTRHLDQGGIPHREVKLGRRLNAAAVADPGAGEAIDTTYGGYLSLANAAANEAARTLPAPNYSGQHLTIGLDTKATAGATGDVKITVANAVDGVHSTLTFSAVGNVVKLEATGLTSLVWNLSWNNGVALS
jgi:hypothetical protein